MWWIPLTTSGVVLFAAVSAVGYIRREIRREVRALTERIHGLEVLAGTAYRMGRDRHLKVVRRR